MKIRLNVGNQLVGYFEIPPFQKLPEAVIWGDRTFRIREKAVVTALNVKDGTINAEIETRPLEPPPMDDCAVIYDEIFAYCIVTERID